MKTACFIIPYFGKLPSYFQLFLNSCRPNKNFDWIIITDDNTKFDYPKNVKRVFCTWQNFKEKVQSKFPFPISLKYGRKLCDYKPTYGYLFEDYLKKYKYWGYCDIDTIMGNLDKLLPLSFLEKYDKLFSLGHMVLFKNTPTINRVFMKPVKNKLYYKESLTNDNITIFDETFGGTRNVDTVFVQNGYKVFHADWSFNPKILSYNFKRLQYIYKKQTFHEEKKKKAICIWNGKDVERFIFNKNKITREEFLYVHLQQRKMKLGKNVTKADAFAIVPNEFYVIDKSILSNNKKLCSLKRSNFNLHVLRILWNWEIVARLKCKKY